MSRRLNAVWKKKKKKDSMSQAVFHPWIINFCYQGLPIWVLWHRLAYLAFLTQDYYAKFVVTRFLLLPWEERSCCVFVRHFSDDGKATRAKILLNCSAHGQTILRWEQFRRAYFSKMEFIVPWSCLHGKIRDTMISSVPKYCPNIGHQAQSARTKLP